MLEVAVTAPQTWSSFNVCTCSNLLHKNQTLYTSIFLSNRILHVFE